jgi:hypothetical protein
MLHARASVLVLLIRSWEGVVTARKQPPNKRLVWRISPDMPKGRWLDATASPVGPRETDLPDIPHSWASSSFDLLSGCDVSDDPDTLSDAQLDELFPPKKGVPGASGA